jgi:hypothetical protein
MSSTLCVRCGFDLIPFSYCKVCNQVVRFVCSSCNMISDERYHLYCKEVSKNSVNKLQPEKEQVKGQILIDTVESSMIQRNKIGPEKHESDDAISLSSNRWNDYLISSFSSYIKSVHDNQDQLNEQLRYSSVNISSSYLSTFFEYLKLFNNYWMKMYMHSSNKLLGIRINSIEEFDKGLKLLG